MTFLTAKRPRTRSASGCVEAQGVPTLTRPPVCVPVPQAPRDRREISPDILSVAISTIHANVKEPFSDLSVPGSVRTTTKGMKLFEIQFQARWRGLTHGTKLSVGGIAAGSVTT